MVAAERVVPGQPVAEHGRLVGQEGQHGARSAPGWRVSIRCVLITPLGEPVEPDVNSTFATVSGPTRRCASSTRAVAVTSTSAANGVERTLGRRRHRYDLDVGRQRQAGQRAIEGRPVDGQHEARTHRRAHARQRTMILESSE